MVSLAACTLGQSLGWAGMRLKPYLLRLRQDRDTHSGLEGVVHEAFTCAKQVGREKLLR